MNKLSSKLSNLTTKTKILLPMTLIALMSVFATSCESPSENRQKIIDTYEKEDLTKNFIDLKEWVYLYPNSSSNIIQTGIALSQFLSKHPDTEIVTITKEWLSNGSFVIITQEKEPCPCEDTIE